jgi:molybdopterin-synthase adenylyltransferase
MKFSKDQIDRYSRNILLKEIGGQGQAKLLNSKVLVVGVGGLGSPVAYYLAASGVGNIGIVDGDNVELSNLQRQIIHSNKNIGMSKVSSAKEKLLGLNPQINITCHETRITSENIMEIFSYYDFIVDCVDSFASKYLINDASVLLGKPFSHCGVVAFGGQVFTHIPKSACLRCLMPVPPPEGFGPTCSSSGILGAVAGIMGSIQATEVIKYLTNAGQLLVDRVKFIDALSMRFNEISLKRVDACPICGNNPSITSLSMGSDKVCH